MRHKENGIPKGKASKTYVHRNNMKTVMISTLVAILFGYQGRTNNNQPIDLKRTKDRGSISILILKPLPHEKLSAEESIESKIAYSINRFDPSLFKCDLDFLCKSTKEKETRGPVILELKKQSDTIEVGFKVSRSDLEHWNDSLICHFVITESLRGTADSRKILTSGEFDFKK